MKDKKELFRILKRAGVPINSYFWVKEFTQRGQRHLHILADIPGWVDQKWLSDVWRKVTHGESFRVWINETTIHNSAGYVMKYLTKVFGEECRYNKGENRYGFCRGAKSYQFPYSVIMGDFWERIVAPVEKPVFELEWHGGDYVRLSKA